MMTPICPAMLSPMGKDWVWRMSTLSLAQELTFKRTTLMEANWSVQLHSKWPCEDCMCCLWLSAVEMQIICPAIIHASWAWSGLFGSGWLVPSTERILHSSDEGHTAQSWHGCFENKPWSGDKVESILDLRLLGHVGATFLAMAERMGVVVDLKANSFRASLMSFLPPRV